MLYMKRSVRDSIVEYGRTSLPFEACGVLYGPAEEDDKGRTVITDWAKIANRASDPLRAFVFDGPQWIASLYAAERSGMKPLGVFHSHPRTSAVPSAEDAEGHDGGKLSCWILSFASPDDPEIAVYRRAGGSVSRLIRTPFNVV